MNKKEKIDQEIEKTLAQFDQKETLPPNPYFFTRVQQRLKKSDSQPSVLYKILRPAPLILLIFLNLSTAFWYVNSAGQNTTGDSRDELIEMMAADLKLEETQNEILILE